MKKNIYIGLALFLCTVVSGFGGTATFDHSIFNKLLAKNVAAGKIKYSAFKTDTNFAKYLVFLENAKVENLSKTEQLAFWVNAYNACVIKNVIDNSGIKKPTDVKGFFDAKKFKVAGKNLTLNEIENDNVRAKFKEPLIHFGLVCGAISCPPIVNKAYSGKTVLSMLAVNAKFYLAGKQNSVNEDKKVLSLSKIFEWYAKDFGDKKSLLGFLQKYGTKQMQDFIKANPDPKIEYLEYDWSINSK